MRLSRRELLASLAALGLVAATPDPVRRYWALDRTMVARPGEWHVVIREPQHLGLAGYEVIALRDRPDLPLGNWDGHSFVRREQYGSGVVFLADALPHGTPALAEAIRVLKLEAAYADDPPLIL